MKVAWIALVLGWSSAPAFAQACFEREPLAFAGTTPTSAAFADLDGDGDLDVGTSALQVVNLFWNDGDGAWATPMTIAIGVPVLWISFADVDGDGDADLLCTTVDARVIVSRNLGAHAFGAAESYAVADRADHFECRDLDADGDVDIVATCSSWTGGQLTTLFNQGDGTFVATLLPLTRASRVAVGDFDADGDPDIAVARINDQVLRVLHNDGAGGFPLPWTTVTAVVAPDDLAVGDFDHDGRADIVVAHTTNRFTLLTSTPSGGFEPHVYTALPWDSRRVTVADLDDDGDEDLALLSTNHSSVIAYFNAGNGVFGLGGVFEVAQGPVCLIDGDIDGDGDPDLAFTSQALGWLRNCGWNGLRTCFGDGSATPCPCGNASPTGANSGCLHSLGAGGTLRATGTSRISADSTVLRGDSMTNASALYFQGTSAVNGGLGVTFGDGLSCAGTGVVRLGAATNAAGSSRYPAEGQIPVSVRGAVTAPGERHYQVWYRNAASFCTASTFNLTNSLRLTWRP